MNALKNEGMWVMIGALLGAGALGFLSEANVVKADHWAGVVALIGAGVASAAVAFRSALAKRKG